MLSSQPRGKLYLIPTFLGENDLAVIPEQVRRVTFALDEFIVEDLRSARRYLRAIGYTKDFDREVALHELSKHATNQPSLLLKNIFLGKHIGLLSEAGNPCIADPGYELVRFAHEQEILVTPLTGPSSILLALIASGLNGQQFTFNGYLPIDSANRIRKLRVLEETARRYNVTQLFIETPYRNNSLMHDALASLLPDTLLSVACDLTLPSEYIATKKIADWKSNPPDLHKRYVVFLLGK